MKSKLIIVGLVVVVTLSLLACGSPSEVSVDVSIDEFMDLNHVSQQTEVKAGGTLTVTLGSNPTTGFRWDEEALIDDPAVVEQTGHEYVAPAASDIVGGAGTEIFVFKALEAGTATVYLEYSRDWEDDEEAEWTYSLTVTVK